MIKINPTKSSPVTRVTNTIVERVDDLLAVEEPLEIQLRYGTADARTERSISVTMRTPGNDEDLALGFLFTEGIIAGINQVKEVKAGSRENHVWVVLNDGEVPHLQGANRNFYTTSACGVCGKTSLEAIRTLPVRQSAGAEIKIKADLLHGLGTTLKEHQATFEITGGLHAAALFDREGGFSMLREDVGRHNALDKVIGASLLRGEVPLSNTILLLSGRASFELIQKACMAGIRIVAAVGAPSSLAVQLAGENDITLVGFLRPTRLNIYSGAQRIITA